MSIDINDINTVSDLISVQQTQSEPEQDTPETDAIIKLILEEEPSVGIDICSRVLYALREFHANGVDMYIEEGKPEFSAQWACDHTKLDTALNLIKDIQL